MDYLSYKSVSRQEYVVSYNFRAYGNSLSDYVRKESSLPYRNPGEDTKGLG